MATRYAKLLGGLLGGAVGDAMGAATEVRTTEMIKEKWGGLVKDIIQAPKDTWAHWSTCGQVTDDFSVSYYHALQILKDKGKITEKGAQKAVLKWFEDPQYSQCAGPTTRRSIALMKGEKLPPVKQDRLLCVNSRASNGGAMKVGCVGLFDACNVDKAIDDAITMCKVTHDNTIALSGAAAIAAATAEAMKDRVGYLDVIQAGIYGAEQGFLRSSKMDDVRPVAGANIVKRIRHAVDLGMRYQGDFDKAMDIISKEIGGGLPAAEAVPAAFGYIAATEGDVMNTIYMAVNAGDDTDTVACMAGYIVGALRGYDHIPARYLALIEKANKFDLQKTASKIEALLEQEDVA
ncbi:MAG: ADP-ribosylglycohydrolase family protein [Solobacterium sp.]|nr:ADP-ribosylglycohydrolase family protein [Solobacterium sp.]